MNNMLRLISIVTVIVLCMVGASGFMPFYGDVMAAQDDNLNWDATQKEKAEVAESSGNYNVFLKTDRLVYKVISFMIWVAFFYILSWLAFSMLVKQNKSPSKAFTVCFSIFMLTVYLGVFLCFSEYFLLQTQDRSITYWRQLNWSPILVGFFVWVPVSIGVTYVLKGK